MKCVFGVSKYTSQWRSVKMHLDNGSGRPLCNTKPGFTWIKENSIPTCAKCKKIYIKELNK